MSQQQVWYVTSTSGQQSGPFTVSQLKALADSAQLSPNDMLWTEGLAEWVAANSFKQLFPETPVAPPVAPRPSSGNCSVSRRRKLRVAYVGAAIAGAIGLLLALYFGSMWVQDTDAVKKGDLSTGKTQSVEIQSSQYKQGYERGYKSATYWCSSIEKAKHPAVRRQVEDQARKLLSDMLESRNRYLDEVGAQRNETQNLIGYCDGFRKRMHEAGYYDW
jgi:hypothetical protein